MKKILALLLAVLMVASLAACGGKDDKDSTNSSTLPGGVTIDTSKLPGGSEDDPVEITLKVWGPTEDIGEGQWLTTQLAAFEKAHPEYIITWEVEVCSEADAKTMVTKDPEAAADVFMFANDQLGDLLNAGALAKLGGTYKDQVNNDNSKLVAQTVTFTDGEVYGFPVTNNTWFLYYNKSMFTADQVKSLDTMLANGKVAFDLANGWYNGSFFFGAGGTLFGPDGTDAAAGVDYNGATGAAVAKKMVQLWNTGNLMDGGNSADLTLMQEKKVGACFSGSWYYNALKDALGDDLGIAVLPTFNVEGTEYTMNSFAGSKAVGVNAHIEDITKQVAATKLASFLASKESQALRFELRSISPTHKDLANSEAVLNHPVASIEVAVMNNCAILQPVISAMGKYWSPMGSFGSSIINGTITEENAGDMLGQTLDQING